MGRLKVKNYTTRASAHGLSYLPLHPTKFDMTLDEAKAEVERWRAYADTVGGDAIIVKRNCLVLAGQQRGLGDALGDKQSRFDPSQTPTT